MKVERREELEEGESVFDITISKAEFNHLIAGCPDEDRISGKWGGVCFEIYDGAAGIGSTFFHESISEVYQLFVGAGDVPTIGEGMDAEEIDELTEEYVGRYKTNLEAAGRIPMRINHRNCGYVYLHLEDGED